MARIGSYPSTPLQRGTRAGWTGGQAQRELPLGCASTDYADVSVISAEVHARQNPGRGGKRTVVGGGKQKAPDRASE